MHSKSHQLQVRSLGLIWIVCPKLAAALLGTGGGNVWAMQCRCELEFMDLPLDDCACPKHTC